MGIRIDVRQTDRILNMLLVSSLVMLGYIWLQKPSQHQASHPEKTTYRATMLAPIAAKKLPAFEPLEALPAPEVQPNTPGDKDTQLSPTQPGAQDTTPSKPQKKPRRNVPSHSRLLLGWRVSPLTAR